ncbi:Pectin lyase-like superfamily protein [Hibiscus syriacus]|uniref:Pectin lyase-like superfamily protein n=1 Tax=Hibiscus syriacus TaxID=106335 RepID=A0A6A3C0T0_HIBSY|nr:Pectin lyase-like superfamily protein [Hibiscus syriacus]
MTTNISKDVVKYKVNDPSDDPVNPKQGILRYEPTIIKGKVWITFKSNMRIELQRPLFLSSFTTIDGCGVDLHVTGAGCLVVYKATDITIHGYASTIANWSQQRKFGSIIIHCMGVKMVSMSLVVQPILPYLTIGSGTKVTTRSHGEKADKALWKFYSEGDPFKNGASFSKQTGIGGEKPNYSPEQYFKVADAGSVRKLTSAAGVLKCSRTLTC